MSAPAPDPTGMAAHGIHRLAIPTPFAVGRVNAYLIEDDPLTLVDSGPNSGTSLEALADGLRGLGHRLEDVELLVLTHQHIDHLGLAEIVRRRSGARVAASEAAVPYVERYSESAAADDEFAGELMLRHGVPADVVRALQAVSQAFRGWGARTTVDRVLRDGERLELGERTLEVRFRPGHSPSDTVLVDAERRLLVAGDHLLRDVSSNPLVTRPVLAASGAVSPAPAPAGERPAPDGRPQALVAYLESLRRTRELDVDLVLPGHGEPFTGHRELIDERLRLHARRAEKIHRLIAERPRTAYEVARALWGDIALTQAYLTLSEVLGHVDLLRNEGRVREQDDGSLVRLYADGD